MFIEHSIKKFSPLRRSGTPTIVGSIALLWSAGQRTHVSVYKHWTPLEPARHLVVAWPRCWYKRISFQPYDHHRRVFGS